MLLYFLALFGLALANGLSRPEVLEIEQNTTAKAVTNLEGVAFNSTTIEIEYEIPTLYLGLKGYTEILYRRIVWLHDYGRAFDSLEFREPDDTFSSVNQKHLLTVQSNWYNYKYEIKVKVHLELGGSSEPLESDVIQVATSTPCPEALPFECGGLEARCLAKRWICDGDADCPDARDESPELCTDQCSEIAFDCGHGKCIKKRWQCDGYAHCPDARDESPDLCLAPPPPGSEVTTDTASIETETSPPTDIAATTFRPPGDIKYRLPRHFSPILYTVRLLPIIGEREYLYQPYFYDRFIKRRNFVVDEGNFTIFGDVTIKMVCIINTQHIVLHINDIDVHQETIKVSGEGLEGMKVNQTSYDKITQFFTIHLSGELKAGMQLSLSMSYLAKLNDGLGCFYKSFYLPFYLSEVRLRYIVTTQFQPTDARRAFPCFDEPIFKARFAITLGRKKDSTSISNAPLNRTVPHQTMPDYEWDIYEESVPMSTYLVAFAISDFVKQPAPNAGKTRVAVWSRLGIEGEGYYRNAIRYATNITSTLLEYFEEFLQIPCPLQKLYMITFPNLGAKAMDNWGSIAYSDRDVLSPYSAQEKERVAVVIAQKLARHWFGNLVTIDWWDLLWLNEGLVTYLKFKGLDWVEPDMEMEQQYVNDAIHSVMQLDGLNSTYEMIHKANSPDEINELFNPITYKKSGSVVRMMADFLGLEVIKEGLTNYLINRTYDTATSDVLWAFLGDAASKYSVNLNGLTVKDIMDTWTLQKKFPVVKVERNPKNYGEIIVTQKMFKSEIDGKYTQKKAEILRKFPHTKYIIEENFWHVPLSFLQNFKNNSAIKRRWLGNSSEPAVYTDVLEKPSSWIICNNKVFGYYRVDYDEMNWDLIQHQLENNHKEIDVINRAQIIDDALNLASANLLTKTYKRALDLTRYLKKEFDWLPWETAWKNFERMQNLLSGTEAGELLNSHIQSLAINLYELYTINEDPSDRHFDSLLRAIAVSIACGTNFAPCVEQAKEIFSQWIGNSLFTDIRISNALMTPIFCSAVKSKEDITSLFVHTLWASEMLHIRGVVLGMTCAKDVILLRWLLELTVADGSPIVDEDILLIYRGMARNEHGRSLALVFIEDNWERIASRTGGYHTATEWIREVSKYYNKISELTQLLRLKEEKAPQLGTMRTLDQAIEQVSINIGWMETHYVTILEWLKEQL